MFRDRGDAGRRLGAELAGAPPPDPVVVLGIPRGGVLVAEGVGAALRAPVDLVVTRKIGAPSNRELAVGAIAPGVQVWDRDLLERLGVDPGYLRRTVEAEEAEIARRTAAYRRGRAAPDLEGRTVVVVDDGLATGATATATVRWARAARAGRVVVAVPVAAPQTVDLLRREADEVRAIETPPSFRAVGEWYEDFGQTSDEEVVAALDRSWEAAG
jgi:predicted phosphoribosyltransferase